MTLEKQDPRFLCEIGDLDLAILKQLEISFDETNKLKSEILKAWQSLMLCLKASCAA